MMHGTERAEAFDTTTRERIRLRILHYKKQHGIGVVRLAERITLANAHKPEIPIKTLQRFLAGKMRTSDLYVGFFEKFAEGLPDPDPVREVGRSMATLYGAPGERDYTGVYSGKGILVSHQKDFKRPFNSEVIIRGDEQFWRITERVGHPDHAIYDGVLVCSGEVAIAVMKDRLTGLPRSYILAKNLFGCGTTMPYRVRRNADVRHFTITLKGA